LQGQLCEVVGDGGSVLLPSWTAFPVQSVAWGFGEFDAAEEMNDEQLVEM